MTDLSTANLKRLLGQAAPGPWRFSEDITDTSSGTQEIGHEVYAEEKFLFCVWDDPVTDEYPGNLPLSALAPELAQEVLRMRAGVERLMEMCLLERDAAFQDTPVRAGAVVAFGLCAEHLTDLRAGDHDE